MTSQLTTQTIKLGDLDFRVKPLVWKQLRVVQPAIWRLTGVKISGLTEEAMNDITTVILTALQPEHPDLTPAMFDNMRVEMGQMMNAISVIAVQAGLQAPKEDAPQGEAPGGSQSTTTA